MNRVTRHETRKISIRPAAPPQQQSFEDHLAVEEPLEIRVHGEPVAVTMRTPGDDPALAAGFLFSKGLLRSPREISSVRHVEDPRHPELRNVLNFELAAGSRPDLSALRRIAFPAGALGVCGKASVEQVKGRVRPVPSKMRVRLDVIYGLGGSLRKARALFEKTGGLHAAGIFDEHGVLHTLHEDVGRLNAVDKAIGHMFLQDRLPLDHHILMVSGRARFEVVHKAILAGIPMVCTAMVPTSLAVEAARDCGVTLLGFFRPDDFNVYTHAERIEV